MTKENSQSIGACLNKQDVIESIFAERGSPKSVYKDKIYDTLKETFFGKMDVAAIDSLFEGLYNHNKDHANIALDWNIKKALAYFLQSDDLKNKLKNILATTIRSMNIQLYKSVDEDNIDSAEQQLRDAIQFYEEFFEYDQANNTVSLDNLLKLIWGPGLDTKEQKENFNESIYAERASHRHKEISDSDFESLKPLATRYSYSMRLEVKMHKFDGESFYIPDYDKVALRYEDMDLQKGSTKENPIKQEREFENISNSYKMQKLSQENNLDIYTINFKESLNTFLHLGQAVADAYGMGVTFDIDFIEKNKEQLKRILYGIYTITGQRIIMPYKIEDGDVYSGVVYPGDAGTKRDGRNYIILSPFISCGS